ncbi:hypothetical protein [Antarctobacter jejuensis]|uniref:hypothetical protein n=1 Tax=Antarctobacter jejuensis TaxID=1439938 RepID=UPI003FD1BA66
MIPNFALALSFEGISLLRRMGPNWARLDEVSLDHADFDSAVIALRDFAESLDPTGAQVALIIPNEQIRYLDQPDLGGEDSARDVAIRASLDGATPYRVDELHWDHVVSGGRLMIAAVAQETLDEARSFAVEHGFKPVCYLARAADGAFDGAVFFGKAEGWTRAVSRPARAIEIVAANKAALAPLPKPEVQEPEYTPEPEPEAVTPPAEEPTEAKAEPAPDEAPEETRPAAEAVEAPAAQEPEPPVAAPVAETPPEPEPKPDARPTVAEQSADTPKAEPVTPAPSAPAATVAPTEAPKSETPKSPIEAAIAARKPVAPTPEAPKVAAPKLEAPTTAVPPAPAPLAAPAAAPLAFSSIRAARGAPQHSDAPALGSALPEDIAPRFTPVAPATAPEPEQTAEPKQEGTGFFARPTASALLAEAAAAADAAEGKAAAKPAAKPDAKTKPAASKAPLKASAKSDAAPKPLTANAPKLPPKSRKAPAPEKGAAAVLPPKLASKLKAKPGVKSIPKAPTRAAALAAAPALDRADVPDSPVAARSAPKKAKTGAGGPNPLAKLAALRGPRTALPAGQVAAAGAAALPAGGTAFNNNAERDRMTIFGARDREVVGGKPRFLGLMLVTLLLLFLAGVAAWASVFLDDKLARLFRGGDPSPVVASLPAGDPAPEPAGSEGVVLESATPDAGLTVTTGTAGAAPDGTTRPVARPGSGVQLATFEAQDDQLDNGPAPLAVPLAPRTLSPEEASVSYAATGIWQRSPGAPMTPPEDGVQDIYVASIDPNIQIFDAVALPDSARLSPGFSVEDPGLPPPPDLSFDFDERNLIRATPEGALSPDGLRIFTGRPPVIPPLRGDSGAGPAPDPVAQPDSVQLAALARVRPNARPEDVIEQRERVQLGGISRAELARFRPAMRPQTVQERAEIESPEATEQAVKASLVPVGRPRNMAAIVEQADKRPDPQPVQTAAIAPRTVQPNLPSSASVARSATLENAINLNRINLIGVYGTPNNRRALVRLPNGKYQKVKVGDRLDGGRVSAIGDGDLRYKKGSRDVVLKMPRS